MGCSFFLANFLAKANAAAARPCTIVGSLDSLPLISRTVGHPASTLRTKFRGRVAPRWVRHLGYPAPGSLGLFESGGRCMGIANRVESITPSARAIGIACLAAAWMLAATPAVSAQNSSASDQRTGVSRPDSTPITVTPDLDPNSNSNDVVSTPAGAPAKFSAGIPAAAAQTTTTEPVYGPYVPYQPTKRASAAPPDPDAGIVTAATAGLADRRTMHDLQGAAAKADPDAGIVTHVPSPPGELPDGTLLKVKLRENLSSLTTRPGTKFTADITEPVMREGRVIVPVGSLLEGRVTWVRGGKRIGGQAAIHLEPRAVTLPDGAQYILRARVIDTDQWDRAKVDDEGTIMRRGNTKRNVGVMSLTTGGGLAAGAMIGGVPGAVIGAGVGAGVSTVVWLKQDHQAELPKNLGVVFSLTEPMSVTPVSAHVTPPNLGIPGGE
jgi:hypothetical protein